MASDDSLSIAIKTSADTKGVDETRSKLASLTKSTEESSNKLVEYAKGARLGLTIASAGIIAFGASTVKSYAESEVQIAQTNAVIKSTGGVAGVTASKVEELASSFQKTTRYSDESIRSAENMLLTFTNIGQKTFPDATKAVLDMSQAMGTDLKSTAIQVGKALQDPILGVTALQKVGVRLTDSQKDLVKQLVETGDTAGAQAVIIKELNTEFGGSAEAAGKTLPGQLDILRNKFDDTKETIGASLVPALKSIMDSLTPMVDTFAKFAGDHPNVLLAMGAIVIGLGALSWAITAVTIVIPAITAAFALMQTRSVAYILLVQGGVTALQTQISLLVAYVGGTAVVVAFAAFAAAGVGALLLVQNAANKTKAALDAADDAVENTYASDSGAILEARRLRATGNPDDLAKAKRIEDSISSRASGGSVNAGQPYLVGDNADGTPNATSEIFVPSQSGTIIPADKTQGLLGGGQTTVNFHAPIYLTTSEATKEFFSMYDRNALLTNKGLTPSAI